MAAKKLFTQIFIYFSKPLRLLYSLIIYEIVNFSFFTLYSLLLLSFFLYLKSVPIYVIVHVHVHVQQLVITVSKQALTKRVALQASQQVRLLRAGSSC